MHKLSIWTIIIFVVLSFFPKTLIAWDRQKYSELINSYREKDNQLRLALGERIYDKTFNRIFDSIVVGLPDVGLTAKNIEKSSGYIYVEGKYAMPPEELKILGDEMVKEIKDFTGYKYNFSGYADPDIKVSIYVVQFTDRQTKVKIKITAEPPNLYPPTLESIYKGVWHSIERQIFLDENLDGDKK